MLGLQNVQNQQCLWPLLRGGVCLETDNSGTFWSWLCSNSILELCISTPKCHSIGFQVRFIRYIPSSAKPTSLVFELFYPWNLCFVESQPVKQIASPAFLYQLELNFSAVFLVSLLPLNAPCYSQWQSCGRGLVRGPRSEVRPLWSCQRWEKNPESHSQYDIAQTTLFLTCGSFRFLSPGVKATILHNQSQNLILKFC